MSEEVLMSLVVRSIRTVILASAPPLVIGLIAGLIVSIFQTVTSIQDATLAFVPKIIAIFFSLVIFGPFMITTILEFMNSLFLNLYLYVQ